MSAGKTLPGTPEPQTYFTGHQGIRLAADAWGDAAGVPVILQHGGGQTRHAWKRTGQVLGDAGFRAIAFDARGHGDSEWSENGDYSQDAMVADLRHIAHAIGKPDVVLVGASMGGGTSLVATGEGTVLAVALVLVDIAPRIALQGVQNILSFMARNPDGFATLDDVADAIATYQPHRPRPTSLQGLAKNVRLGLDGRLHWHWDPKMMLGHRDVEAREARLRKCARALRVPSLLVRGSASDVLTDDGVQDYLESAADSEYLNIVGAGHMVAGDRNDVFGKAVVEFLTRPTLKIRKSMSVDHRASVIAMLDATDLNDVP
jgi:pimeloyl-ACP methyl ester carboxylesterase